MKLTIFLLLCSILQVGARGFAQKITLSERQVSPDKIFSRIEQQTGYKFVYTESFLKNSRPVTHHLFDDWFFAARQDQQLGREEAL